MERKDLKNNLYAIASLQQGYFTAKQAKEAGYSDSRFPYHVQQGQWIHEGRGIYKLAHYPPGEQSDLVYWSLWSCNRTGEVQGVFSHQTALVIHDLSEVMPATYQMIVPKSFRKYHSIPDTLCLRFITLAADEIWELKGYRVTSPIRTIKDIIINEEISEELVLQAVQNALQSGMLSLNQCFSVKENLQNERAKRIFKVIGNNDRQVNF